MSPARLLFGFLVGVLAVLTFHQGMVFLLGLATSVPTLRVYQWTPTAYTIPLLGWPIMTLVNQSFWGGLWGVLFVLIWDRIPTRFPGWLFGILFGILGPAMINWTLLPYLRGQPYFGGGDPARIAITAAIGSSFGLGLSLLLPLVARFFRAATASGR